MKSKTFDCVEMKRKAAEKIYEKIKDMSVEDELRFWNGAEKKMVEKRKNNAGTGTKR